MKKHSLKHRAEGSSSALPYRERDHEQVLGHIKIVKNEKVAKTFANKESFGLFFNAVFLGHIELTNGNALWLSIDRQGRRYKSKAPEVAVTKLIEPFIRRAIDKALPVKQEEEVERGTTNREQSRLHRQGRTEVPRHRQDHHDVSLLQASQATH